MVRRAGWVHDLGRVGVSNEVWDKTGPLTAIDRERLQMYPFLSGWIMGRVTGMRRVAEVAGAHRERLDGSGYPRGLRAGGLDPLQRILAVADAYQGALEPRPHRSALEPREAGAWLLGEVRTGRLDRTAAEAVLAAAGAKQGRRRPLPSGLTARELEVLRLLCRGLEARKIAAELVISPKTARNHVEHIYAKTGCSNRVAATLFALDAGLWERDEPAGDGNRSRPLTVNVGEPWKFRSLASASLPTPLTARRAGWALSISSVRGAEFLGGCLVGAGAKSEQGEVHAAVIRQGGSGYLRKCLGALQGSVAARPVFVLLTMERGRSTATPSTVMTTDSL